MIRNFFSSGFSRERFCAPATILMRHLAQTASPLQELATGISAAKRARMRFAFAGTSIGAFDLTKEILGISHGKPPRLSLQKILNMLREDMGFSSQEKICIFGSSRGLGWALAQRLNLSHELLLISRKAPLESLPQSRFVSFDVAKTENQPEIFSEVECFAPTRIIYSIGGGPYGEFASKHWKDHLWAWEVNFLFPARLLHFLLSHKECFASVKQVIFIGSQIAEAQPDPLASSYASAKHALRGLILTVQKEGYALSVDLFSPGYMDTDLLPKHAWPRQSPGLVQDPKVVAEELEKFIFTRK